MPSRDTPLPLVGLHYFATDTSMPVLELAQAAAARGFDSLVLPEHTHMPVDSRYPADDGEVPDRYRRSVDPYTALAFVAAQTGLRIGTCISLIAQHDPIVLAKTIATLDLLSEGRFTLGVGYGWNRLEFADHGHRFTDRRQVAREHVAVMRALWRDDVAAFDGTFTRLSPSWAWPKPYRRPSVPVLLGCSPTPRGFADVAAWADGWIPVCPDAELLAAWLPALQREWEASGRDVPPVIWAMQHGQVLDDDALRRSVDRFCELGVDQVVLDVQTAGRDELLPVLDRYAAALAKAAR